MCNSRKSQNKCNCLCDNRHDLTIIYGRDEKIRSRFSKALSVAISEARKAPMATQYGAVICDENTGEIYARGHNHWKSVQTNKALQCVLCSK
jgi:membrane peptidoglycan carboxypeptidase